ncbi:unnamed protein product [Linum trigynum]|uniref:Uncharacterized protein n=1 Tax=Linum trigynum TaxID=586398 RepID=A0AAV2F6G4_9ROSI
MMKLTMESRGVLVTQVAVEAITDATTATIKPMVAATEMQKDNDDNGSLGTTSMVHVNQGLSGVKYASTHSHSPRYCYDSLDGQYASSDSVGLEDMLESVGLKFKNQDKEWARQGH